MCYFHIGVTYFYIKSHNLKLKKKMYQSIMYITIQSYNNFNIDESVCWFWLNVYFLWIISIVIRSEMHSGEYGMGR